MLSQERQVCLRLPDVAPCHRILVLLTCDAWRESITVTKQSPGQSERTRCLFQTSLSQDL